MAEILLQELSNTDIDWMVASGQREGIAAGTILIKACQDATAVYLLLEGTLDLLVPLTKTAALDVVTTHSHRPIVQLSRGEIIGEAALFNFCSMPAIVRATENVRVLAIPLSQLREKLAQDMGFSAHFYRAIALILSNRLREISKVAGQIQLTHKKPLKDALFVFAELRDSDVDWLMTVGKLEKLAAGKVLIHAGRPVDALYLVLDGLLSVGVPQVDCDPLSLCFQGLEKQNIAQKIISYFSRGEIAGAISALDLRPFPTTIQATKETLVLAVPRHALAAKLEQDLSFATRFYRVIAIQLLNIVQTVMNQLGCDQQMYTQDQALDEEMEYDDELCLTSLTQLSQGAARFNWMLKRLGVV